MLIKIFLISLILFGCSDYPMVTLHSLDTQGKKFYPYKITKYDKQSCELVLEEQPIIPMSDPSMNGAVCITKEDYSKLQAKAKADCRNDQQNNIGY